MRRLSLLALVALLAGCGGSDTASVTTTPRVAHVGETPAEAMAALARHEPALAGRLRTLFIGSGWSVVQASRPDGASAVAFHLVAGRWHADETHRVSIQILGPNPGEHVSRIPQVAIEIGSKKPFVEAAIWVDGTQLSENGGGSSTEGTIYGAPAHALKPGIHIAVGYARTALSGAAVAWVFVVS